MFRVAIDNGIAFNNFINSCDTSFVDIYLNEKIALFVLNTSETFSIYMQSCKHSAESTGKSFRVQKALLKQQVLEGFIDISFQDDSVLLSFLDTEENICCNVKFPMRKAISTVYDDKLALMKGNLPEKTFNLNDLGCLSKISRSTGGLIRIDSNFASVVSSLGARVYRKINFNGSICISYASYTALQKCNNNIFTIKNYVGAKSGNFVVIVSKSRTTFDTEDITTLMDDTIYRVQYKADIDFYNILRFLRNHKSKLTSLDIELSNRECHILDEGFSYTIPISIRNEQKAKTLDFTNLMIPYSMMMYVIGQFSNLGFVLKKKKSFFQLEQNDYSILFS